MDKKQLPLLCATELVSLLSRREVSPVELVEAFLERIDAMDARVHAYITICRDEALAAARKAEQAKGRRKQPRPLHGLPFAVKDQLFTRGIRTTIGSKILEEFVPDYDATTVARLKAAGAILLGKLNMTEFVVGVGGKHPFGEPRNPWDLARSPGSSSNGCGVAISASLCPTSLGEDTGGSIRGPAAWCGIVGLRPTWGLVSRYGVLPMCWSMDTVGPMTKTVEDAALLLGTIAGYDAKDPYTCRRPVPDYVKGLDGNIRGVKAGLVREYMEGEYTHPEVREAVRKATSVLESLGATVEECSIPLMTSATTIGAIIAETTAAFVHRQRLRRFPTDYGKVTRRRLLAGSLVPTHAYHKAERLRALLREQMAGALERLDVLITPTQLEPPPVLVPERDVTSKEEAQKLVMVRLGATSAASLAGCPAISVPCGFTSDKLPIGLQIIGRPFADETVLKVAHAYEQSTEWHTFRPLF